MRSLRKAKRSAEPTHQAEYRQLEFQRRNPQLYTTLTQCVGAEGQIVTIESVTKNLRATLEALDKVHVKQFKGEHPLYCLRPLNGQPEHDVCAAIEHCNSEMDKVRMTFIRNYKHLREAYANDVRGDTSVRPKEPPVES